MDTTKDYILNLLSNSWPILLKLILGVVGFFVALYIVKLAVKLIIKVLNLAQVYKLDAKLNAIEIFEGKSLNINSIKIIATFFKYVLYIILIMIGSELMGLQIISNQISDLISYSPKLLSGVIIFVIGLLLANFAKQSLKSLFESMDISGGKLLSQLVFFLILIFITITALNQAQVDTDIITKNLTLIIGAFLLAFTIAFGFGAKGVMEKLLKAFYARKTFEIGQKIIFNSDTYTIETVSSISVVLKNAEGKLVVPIEDIVEQQIQIKD